MKARHRPRRPSNHRPGRRPTATAADQVASSTRVPAPKSPDIDTFARFLDNYVAELPCWSLGVRHRHELLAWFNRYPVRVERDEVQRRGTPAAVARLTRPHHNMLGLCVAWVVRQRRDADERPRVSNGELAQVFELAGTYWQLANALADVRQGIRSFSSRNKTIEIRYTGNAQFDSLDRMLGLLDEVLRLEPEPPAESESVGRLLQEGRAIGQWDDIGLLVQQEYRSLAGRLLQSRVDIPMTTSVGLATLGDAIAVITELLARALHAQTMAMQGIEDPALVTPVVSRNRLRGAIAAATSVEPSKVAEVLDLMTLNLAACPDPCLTPLVPVDDSDALALVSGLMVPGSHVRNFLARLQLDPSRYGEAGRQLGLLGSRAVAASLRDGLPAARVAERVPVLRSNGSQEGDLDVVAYDPATMKTVVFEVLWDVGVDGSVEAGRTEQRSMAKREQVGQLRAAITSGRGKPRFPPSFDPDLGSAEWMILTANILPIAPAAADGVPIRSHLLLKMLLNKHKDLAGLLAALHDPPPPPRSLATLSWGTLRFGPYLVRVEVLPG